MRWMFRWADMVVEDSMPQDEAFLITGTFLWRSSDENDNGESKARRLDSGIRTCLSFPSTI